MRRPLLSVLLALSACWASAQQNYGNEWIDYDQRYWAFWVATDQYGDPFEGLWRIDSTTLANAGFPLSTTDAQAIQVWGRERQVAIWLAGDSDHVFNGTDFIELYAPRNDAWLDSALWDDPSHINNPYFSAIGDSMQFFLTIGDPAQSKRVVYLAQGDWTALPTPELWYWAETTTQPNPSAGMTYKRGQRDHFGLTTSWMSEGEGFTFNDYVDDGSQGVNDEIVQTPRPWMDAGAPPMKVTTVVQGANSASDLSCNDHHLRVTVGAGQYEQVVDTQWTAEKTIKMRLDLPAGGYAHPQTYVVYDIVHDLNLDPGCALPSDYPDRQALAYIHIEYPRDMDAGPFLTKFHRMHFPNDGQDIRLEMDMNWDPVIYVFGDTVWRVTTEIANGGWKNCRLPYSQGADTTHAFMTAADAIQTVPALYAVNGTGFFNDYGAQNVDSALIIVTHPKLMDGALQYAQYRESNTQNHHNTVVADVEELYQQFGGGILRHPVAIRRFVRNLRDRFETEPEGLFLIGKGIQAAHLGGGDYVGYRGNAASDTVAHNRCLVPSMGYPPSDALFTLGLSGNPWEQTIPVGRLAAQTNQQVIDYKNKVQELEIQQATPAAWMKNILHFRGGFTDNEVLLFQSALSTYEMIAEDTCFAGHVTEFVKNPDDFISQASADSVYDLVQEGVTLMTFFAHASGGGFDISIDQPNNYQWNGRYPFMIGNSCYTGNIHLPSSGSGSEQFVLPAGAGAIAFLASNDLGLSFPLYGMTANFYTSFSRKNYGASIGRHIQYMDSVALYTNGADISVASTVHQFTLHGDPLLIMNSPLLPDMEITNSDLRLSPNPVTADVDSFQVSAVVRNLGNACRCPEFPVAAVRQIGQNTPLEPVVQQLDLNTWQDTVHFTLPVLADSGGAGLNNLIVRVDRELVDPGVVDEFEDITNNEASLGFLITSGDLIPVDPFNFAITLDPAPLLQASTGDPFAPMRNYLFQIDTIDTYDSPMLEQGTVSAPGGVVSWQPQSIYTLNTQQDSLVFFWRCSVDSAGNDGYDWKEFSFQYIPGRKGWGQAHHMQFKDTVPNNSFENLIHSRPERDFEFFTGARDIGAVVQGNSGAVCKWTKDLVTQEGSPGCAGNTPSLMLAVIDPFDFTAWRTWWQQTGHHLGAFNSGPCTTYRPFLSFIYREDEPVEMSNLALTLADSIPDGHYILIYTLKYLTLDNVNFPLGALAGLGADSLMSGLVPDSVPYIFFCRKGYPNIGEEVWGENINSLIDFAAFVNVTGNSGTMKAPRSAEMLLWNSLHWEIDPTLATDSARISISTVNIPENAEQLTYIVDPGATTDSLYFDDIGVNSALHPRIRLGGAYNSVLDNAPRPAQTKRWQIVGTPAPECAIDPPLGYFIDVDSLFEGQTARIMVAVHNISDVPMDNLLIAAWVTDQTNYRHLVHYKYNEPLPVNGVVLDTISFTLEGGYAGMNALVIEANPVDTLTGVYDQREQYHFNNIATLRFETFKDRENPVLDVTFDGVHILDGDIVSAKPEIKLNLDDENTTLLFDDISDTAVFKVFLLYPDSSNETRIPFRGWGGTEIMQFIPTQGTENTCKVLWRPEALQDGIYRLRIQAQDISRNESGSHDYSVKFEVINKPTITEVLNYPNPFTTSTRFVFTLTGSEVPTGMRIRIMTISGRVVREIMVDELGPMHIGRNITDYAWDGHDQFGDKLARGVYLYQVVAQLNGQDIEYRETSAGGYFTKGFGKMYLLR
jgi:hypothetical protein